MLACLECADPTHSVAVQVDGETQGIGCVVMRDPVVPQNISGTQEQFIPARLLFGIVPQALLDKYNFWQDDNDNIRFGAGR